MKKTVDPSLYDRKYYTRYCGGYKEFNKSKGKLLDHRLQNIIKTIPKIKKGMEVLDVGCGRGEIVQWCAKMRAEAYGIDFSNDAILIAQEAVHTLPLSIRKRITYKVMDCKDLTFPDKYFDMIISLEVYEHLYSSEKIKMLQEMKRVLKDNGTIYLHTEPNKLYQSYFYRSWSYPLSSLLIFINKIFTGRNYPNMYKLDKKVLNEQRTRHVGEPTYFSIKRDIKKVKLKGNVKTTNNIWSKPNLSWKDRLYNLVVYLDPLSKHFPFNILWGQDFMIILRK